MTKRREGRRGRAPHAALIPAAVVALCALVTFAAWREQVGVSVEIADPVVDPRPAAREGRPAVASLPDGEVERMAHRVREGTALLMGLTLSAALDWLARQSNSAAEGQVTGSGPKGSLPPGVRGVGGNNFESDLSRIAARFRLDPPAVEIFSEGRGPKDGPPLLIRITTGGAPGAELFVASGAARGAPRPFATAAELGGLGFLPEPLRERQFAAGERELIGRWLGHSAAAAKR